MVPAPDDAVPVPRATLHTVARAAGVSRQTVSNVLNDPAKVQPATADRVREAIESQSYRPFEAARQLRTGRSHTVGLCLPPGGDGINGSVLDRFLHALTEHAQLAGYRITLFTAGDDADEIAGYERLLATNALDGFVLTSTHHGDPRTAWLLARAVPFVTFGRPWSTGDQPVAAHAWVDVDGAAGTRAATTHLLEAGHRHIAFLGWPAGSGVGDDRREGWRSAMAGVVRSLDGLDLAVEDDVTAGQAAVDAALAGGFAPSAVVCASDSLALGARGSALRRGVRLDVVGFDDTPVAAALGLSSVAQPLVLAAEAVVALLLSQLERARSPARTPAEPTHRLLEPALVLRGSRALPTVLPHESAAPEPPHPEEPR